MESKFSTTESVESAERNAKSYFNYKVVPYGALGSAAINGNSS